MGEMCCSSGNQNAGSIKREFEGYQLLAVSAGGFSRGQLPLIVEIPDQGNTAVPQKKTCSNGHSLSALGLHLILSVLSWGSGQNKNSPFQKRWNLLGATGGLWPSALIKNTCGGLPWWRSGWESACQCRGHGFEPWCGKIPHAAEQLGPWATTTEPARLEPVLRNKKGRDSERPVRRDEEWPPLVAIGESPRTEMKTKHSQK